MQNGNGSSSRSTQQLVTPAAGNLKGLMSGGGGGGDKPPRYLCRMKSIHELDAAGAGRGSKRPVVPTIAGRGDEYERFQCSFCDSFFISQEDLHCHIRRCHVHRSWRRGGEDAPRPPPSVAGRCVSEKRLSLGGNPSSSIPTGKKGLSMLSKQQKQQPPQLADEAAPEEALARPAEPLAFDLNVPASEEEEKGSSG